MKAILSLLMFCSACAFGQRRLDVDRTAGQPTMAFFQAVNGVPVMTNVYYKVVEGSAFFNDNWQKGSAALSKEVEYRNLSLKLDLLENRVHFRDTKGNEMICTTPINGITLIDSVSGKTHRFAHSSFIPALSNMKETWMEVRADGPAQLYTQHKKTVSETRPYSSATLEQRIITIGIHYLVVGNKATRVKKLSDVLAALPADKKQDLQQWIKTNKFDEKNTADFALLVDYYNSLQHNTAQGN